MKLAEIPEAIKPSHVVRVPTWSFAETWQDRPDSELAVGMRRLSMSDKATVLQLSDTFSEERGEFLPEKEKGLVLDDTRKRLFIAKSLCDVNDTARPPKFFLSPETDAFEALSDQGTDYLFEEVLRANVLDSPCYPEITEEQLGELADLIDDGAIAGHKEESSIRRYLGYAFDCLTNGG